MRLVVRALPIFAFLLLAPLASSDTVRALPPPGYIDLFAGGGAGDGGPATSASLNTPTGIAVDATGNVYIGDQLNCRVRQVSGGVISSIVGNGICFPESPDGTLAAGAPDYGAIVAARGSTVYFSENSIRTISGGILGTVAGSGSTAFLSGMSFDAAGDLYFTIGCSVQKISGGVMTVVAGQGACGFSGDGGPATSARLDGAQDVAVDVVSGDFYVADKDNCRIRRISAGIIDTVAGTGVCGFNGDGASLSSMLNQPYGVAVDSSGDVVMVDKDNCRVRRLSGGTLTTITGNGTCTYGGDGGPGTAAALRFPTDVAVGPVAKPTSSISSTAGCA